MKKSLNLQIFIGAATGIAFGLIMQKLGSQHSLYGVLLYVCDLLGTCFINLLKMLLVPLVFTSITTGIANLREHAQMGRVWKTTLLYFITTTALAVLLGMIVVNIFKPGVGLPTEMFKESMQTFEASTMSFSEFFKTFLEGLFLNPFAALAQAKILPIVIFSLLLGITLVQAGPKANQTLKLLNEGFYLIMRIVDWVMTLAPIGIMALLAKAIAVQDVALLAALGKFMAVVIGATLFHGLVSLPVLLYFITRYNPFQFFMGVREALITAFSTSSSSATLPVTMRCVEENLGVDRNVSNFVLPLGATINMDGTALYEAVAALFVANLVGADLNVLQQLIVYITAIIAAIGAPGIPSAGMVTMAMVLQSVGLPVEAIAILLPIDRILDAIRTTINVGGDTIGCKVVQHLTTKKG